MSGWGAPVVGAVRWNGELWCAACYLAAGPDPEDFIADTYGDNCAYEDMACDRCGEYRFGVVRTSEYVPRAEIRPLCGR